VRETAISLVLYAGVAVAAPLLGLGHVVLFGWVIPAVVGLCAVAPYILMPEHYGAPQDRTIVESTATVRSNPLLSFVYLNNNHHTAHHLLSSCNPLQLGEITDLLGDRVELRYRSYASFHREVFRSLRW
jgi:fatty acid desaturase